MQVPIAHIHGGEVTIGAIDESLCHAITKLTPPFQRQETYRYVIQMAEALEARPQCCSSWLETPNNDLPSLEELWPRLERN